MAKKKEIGKKTQEVKEVLESGRAIIGRDKVLTNLKNGKLEKVFLSSNAPQELKDDLGYYSDLAKVEVISLDQDNEELGVLAKKNYLISVLGVSN